MDPVDKLPGVTFYIRHSALTAKVGAVTLDAVVEDPDLWEHVLKKLDGFRVYTVADLQSALIECMQEENQEAKSTHARELATLREELERNKQRISMLEKAAEEHTKFNEELRKLEIHGINIE